MKDILGTLQALQNTPVPNLLVIGGFILLFLAFIGKFGAFVELSKGRQKWAGIIGALLLVVGIGLFIVPSSQSDSTPPEDVAAVTPDTPAVTPILPTNTLVEKPPNTSTPELPTNTPAIQPTDTPIGILPEQAIRDYYALIQQGQYEIAWEMSEEYSRVRKGLSFEEYVSEWEESGSATIVEPMRVEEVDDQATVTLTLYYPKKDATHVVRYKLTCDAQRGSQRFGYWIFAAGEVLP